MGRVTRSKGPAAKVPNINFPVESRAYQKRLADLHDQAASQPREDAAAQSSPSTVPEVGEGHDGNNVPPPSARGDDGGEV